MNLRYMIGVFVSQTCWAQIFQQNRGTYVLHLIDMHLSFILHMPGKILEVLCCNFKNQVCHISPFPCFTVIRCTKLLNKGLRLSALGMDEGGSWIPGCSYTYCVSFCSESICISTIFYYLEICIVLHGDILGLQPKLHITLDNQVNKWFRLQCKY